jgi:glycerol dehydrogenase
VSKRIDELNISPSRVIAGFGALAGLGPLTASFGEQVLIVGGEKSFPLVKEEVERSLAEAGVAHFFSTYGRDSSRDSVFRLVKMAAKARAIVGIGGGKALDTAKMVAHHSGLPVLTVPTSPATCACWSALSNEYSEEGAWQETVLHAPPAVLLLDYEIVGKAPDRLFASGIADALAKWYEGRTATVNCEDLSVKTAMQIADLLKKELFKLSAKVLQSPELGQDRIDAIDAAIRLPGLIGGIGGEKCRTVAAHALCNTLTNFPGFEKSLHGEKVGFGILVQLLLEEAPPSEITELFSFFRSIRLPLTLKELGFSPELAGDIALRCCETQSSLRNLPFPVYPGALARAIRLADSFSLQSLRT